MKIYYWIGYSLFVLMCVYIIYKYVLAVINRPHFQKPDILYQERFASGCSTKNILTRLGGGKNCVRLVITKDFLWVTSWFPFSILAPAYDMERVIPLDRITEVGSKHSFISRRIHLTYVDGNGYSHSLRLFSRNEGGFLRAIAGDQDDNRLTKSR